MKDCAAGKSIIANEAPAFYFRLLTKMQSNDIIINTIEYGSLYESSTIMMGQKL